MGKRVLVVIVGDYSITGVVTYLEERLPRLIVRCQSDVTLFVPGKIIEKSRAKRLADAGVRFIEGNIHIKDPIARRIGLRKKLHDVFQSDSYDVVHVNTASRLVNLIALSEAARAGVPVRIAHSHTANSTLGLIAHLAEPYYRCLLAKRATDLLACSNEAGEFLCGRRVWQRRGVVVPNGIDVGCYEYSEDMRRNVRNELSVGDNSLVVGFVGRMSPEKNPLFLIRVFAELALKNKHAVLWMVGEGDQTDEVKELAENLGVSDRVVFFGRRDDVHRLMQAFDVLVLPSLYEGFLLVLVEGEASGVPCFVSDSIPRASRADGCPVTYLSLGETPEFWANAILASDLARNPDGAACVEKAGLTIEAGVDALCGYY